MNDRASVDKLEEAAQYAAQRKREETDDPESSLGSRLGQIGVLGWMTVTPALAGLVIGRLADRSLQTGIFFSAPSLMLGAALGFWLAIRWMHRGL